MNLRHFKTRTIILESANGIERWKERKAELPRHPTDERRQSAPLSCGAQDTRLRDYVMECHPERSRHSDAVEGSCREVHEPSIGEGFWMPLRAFASQRHQCHDAKTPSGHHDAYAISGSPTLQL